jgi:hypothetical protein
MAKYKIAGEITDRDLDADPVVLGDGSVLTEELAQEWADEAEVRMGRPPLEAHRRGPSPRRSVRFGPRLDARLEARAKAEGKSPSEVVREAVEAYL